MCNEDGIGAVLGHVSGGVMLTLVGGEALELLPALKVTNYLKAATTATSDALLATKSGSKALNVTKNFLKTPEYTRKAGTNLIEHGANWALHSTKRTMKNGVTKTLKTVFDARFGEEENMFSKTYVEATNPQHLMDQISNKAFNAPNWISGLEAYGYSKISPKERFKDNVYTKLKGGK